MKKLIIFSIIIFSSFNFQTKENNINKTTDKDSAIHKKTDIMLLTSSSSIKASKNVKLYGCDFNIVLNNLKDTTHWSTNDENFITPEGFKVGTPFKNLTIEIKNSMRKMPGWGYYTKLNSGWELGFCIGNSCIDHEPNGESKVKWIFKRNR